MKNRLRTVGAAAAGAALTLTIACTAPDAPLADPAPPEYDLTCGPGEWANDDLTACEPLPEPVYEDEPGFDCRTMGNHQCGVQVMGTWYVITFDGQGQPVAVRER